MISKEELMESLRQRETELHALQDEVERLREQQQKILRIAETNKALDWDDRDASAEWAYIIDMIKGDD